MFSKAYIDSRLNDHLLNISELASSVVGEVLSEFSSAVRASARLRPVLDWENARGAQKLSNAAVSNRVRSLLINMRWSDGAFSKRLEDFRVMAKASKNDPSFLR